MRAGSEAAEVYVHASAVVVGEAGILLRGPSGAGKTTLALALVAEARRDGDFARFVADDRVGLRVRGQRLIARPHPRVAGLVECRGLGIMPIDFEPACVIGLVVDLLVASGGTGPPRMPDAEALGTELLGLRLPALTLVLNGSTYDPSRLILGRLSAFRRDS